jgi:hypothetical protein
MKFFEKNTAKYDVTEDFYGGLAVVQWNGKWSYIDLNSKAIIPVKYCKVLGFFNGLFRTGLNNKTGYIETTGKEVVPLKCDEAK